MRLEELEATAVATATNFEPETSGDKTICRFYLRNSSSSEAGI